MTEGSGCPDDAKGCKEDPLFFILWMRAGGSHGHHYGGARPSGQGGLLQDA